LECVNIADRQAMAISYHSIENFRSKLAMCGNLVSHKFGKSDGFQKWVVAEQRTTKLASKRNKIAHGWHKLYINNTEGVCREGTEVARLQYHAVLEMVAGLPFSPCRRRKQTTSSCYGKEPW
jgi:hypothetical protein